MRRASFFLKSMLMAGICAIAAASFSQNTTIIGNLAGSNDNEGSSVYSQAQKALGFTMGGADYDLVELALRLDFGLNPVSVLDVSLYSNNGGQLGSKLGSFETKTATTGSGGPVTVVLEPTGSPFRKFRLKANQSYWILVRSHGSSFVNWPVSNPSVVPTGVATHLGALWNNFGPGLPTNPSNVLNTYELRGTLRPATAWYLQDPATGQIGVASYKNSHFTNWATFPQVVGSAWEVQSFGQYGSTDQADAFLRNKSTGKLAFWFANSSNFFQFVEIPQTPPSVWKFHGTTRFEGETEYPVYQNPQSGVVVLGVHNESQFTQWRIFPKVPNLAWEIVAVGDTNNDNIGDVMFRNKTTGQLAVWRTNGNDFTTWHVFPQVPSSAWEIVDIIGYPALERGVIFRNKTTKEYAVWRLNGAGTAFTNWMPITPQPDTKFNYKGWGLIQP